MDRSTILRIRSVAKDGALAALSVAAGMLELVDCAVEAGWPVRRAAATLELTEGRVWRWPGRRAHASLADRSVRQHV